MLIPGILCGKILNTVARDLSISQSAFFDLAGARGQGPRLQRFQKDLEKRRGLIARENEDAVLITQTANTTDLKLPRLVHFLISVINGRCATMNSGVRFFRNLFQARPLRGSRLVT